MNVISPKITFKIQIRVRGFMSERLLATNSVQVLGHRFHLSHDYFRDSATTEIRLSHSMWSRSSFPLEEFVREFTRKYHFRRSPAGLTLYHDGIARMSDLHSIINFCDVCSNFGCGIGHALPELI